MLIHTIATPLSVHFFRLLLFACCCCFAPTPACQAQLSKSTTQTISIDGAETLKVDIRHAQVIYKRAKGSRIIVEAQIQLSVPNETLLNFVINNGRYQLHWKVDSHTKQLYLTSMREKDMIMVRGEVCYERVIYTIYVPKSLRPPSAP